MAPNRGRNRASDFDDLRDTQPSEFDPEADDLLDRNSESDDDQEGEAPNVEARDHYIDVGKSKLRTSKSAALGPQYRGSRITRNAVIDDQEEHDPFGNGFDNEDSEDDSRDAPNGRNTTEGSSEDGSVRDDSNEDDGTDTNISSGEDQVQQPRPGTIPSVDERKEVLRALHDQEAVTSSLARSRQADVEKGNAVKKQRTTYDSFLSTRMKLQKSMVATNTIVGTSAEDLSAQSRDARAAIDAAEAAAFKLWSSVSELRDELAASTAGVKRKRSTFTPSTPVSELWSHMQTQESASLPRRNATLRTWSKKVRAATATPQQGFLNASADQISIIDALQQHLLDRGRLVKRAHTPRSCAPLQGSLGLTEDPKIYDDADFYGLLLKELLEQRSQDSVAASTIDLDFHLRREVKTRKNVDTKASKGRKLSYLVHEKLQNFMAPEDRTRWGERQTDELFGSLFGQKLGLGETNGTKEDAGDDGDAEEAGLMMFRS